MQAMSIVAPPLSRKPTAAEYRIASWEALRVPLWFGPTRGQRWLPFSGGKLLRLLLGTYEPDQTCWVASQLKPGNVLFDVGAAVGYYTLVASPLVGPEGLVVAFEPDPKNAAFLRRHVAINQLKNVEVHQAAIGDCTGQACFTRGTGTGTGHLDESGEATVTLWKLDDILEHTRTPTHIKIDVEGAELDVLEGARNLLSTARPTLFLSTHGAIVHQACCRFLAQLGYHIQPISADPRCDSEVVCIAKRSMSSGISALKRSAA